MSARPILSIYIHTNSPTPLAVSSISSSLEEWRLAFFGLRLERR